MKRGKLYLITGYKGFFGQTRKPWVSIDTDLFISLLKEAGIEIVTREFHQLAREEKALDAPVFYGFSQIPALRDYMKDVVEHRVRLGDTVLPSLELLLCHENKGYQELVKQRHGITCPRGWYMSGRRVLDSYDIPYPVVLKEIEGSNANGVFLVRSRQELDRQLDRIAGHLGVTQRIDLMRRLYLRKHKTFPGYAVFDARQDAMQYREHITPDVRFVLQEFIPNLTCDYRVIILGHKYYVTRRMTREGDFRASGAKRFVFDDHVDPALLNYARDLFERFDTPVLSLDIGVAEHCYALFEFQALHFGINAIVRSNGYWCEENGAWLFKPRTTSFEEDAAQYLLRYLEKKNLIDNRKGSA